MAGRGNLPHTTEDKKPVLPRGASRPTAPRPGAGPRLGSLASVDTKPMGLPGAVLAGAGPSASVTDPATSGASTGEFTHGGVRKTKFVPKIPARRAKKQVQDRDGEGDADDKLAGELKNIVASHQEAGIFGARPKAVGQPAQVAFGYGSSAGVKGSFPGMAGGGRGFSGGGGGGGGGGGKGGGGIGKRGVAPEIETMDEAMLDSKNLKGKRYEEPFDYSKNVPITLPLRRPGGNQEVEEEPTEDATGRLDESTAFVAKELGLETESLSERLIFLQLPPSLPIEAAAVSALQDPPDAAGPSTSRGPGGDAKQAPGGDKPLGLESIPRGGRVGKLLVHKSGAVKLNIGNILFHVSPGARCNFYQEMVAVNPQAKECHFLGPIEQRIIISPDIDFLMDQVEAQPQSSNAPLSS